MRQQQNQNHKHNFNQRCSRALCCSCRLSVSSDPDSSASSSSSSSERFGSISTLAHAMVQERLDQMIKERHYEMQPRNSNNMNNNIPSSSRNVTRQQRSSSNSNSGATKFVLMVAMEKCTDDPREDFRESMVEMIIANRIEETGDLRTLLNYYVTMNSEEYYGVILEVFHQLCSSLFLYSCKP